MDMLRILVLQRESINESRLLSGVVPSGQKATVKFSRFEKRAKCILLHVELNTCRTRERLPFDPGNEFL
jgi:hypothetical protein